MDTDDADDLINLFDIGSSNVDMQVSVKSKSAYEPIHLPLSIIEIEILET